MTSTRLAAVVVWLSVSACGAPVVVRDASRCRGAIDADPPSRDPLVAAVVAAERAALDRLVGRFTRGQLPTYGGRVRAHGGRGEHAIAGDVVASMAHHRGELFVVALRSREYFVLSQHPDRRETTDATPIMDRFTAGGAPFSCQRCLPDLASVPRRIDLRGLVLAARHTGSQLAPLVLDGAITRLASHAITLDDVRAVTSVTQGTDVQRVLDSLVDDGDVWTRSVSGSTGIATEAPDTTSPTHPECALVVDYTAEWWIDARCAARYGVRDVRVIRTARRCCARREAQPAPCSAPPPPDCVSTVGAPP
ncbi:MAG: hypothetical protein IT379_29930 [Deltaproteobacteria bacterium]|nr:hypothetical protein [Deltaproteobacteria bacterium]